MPPHTAARASRAMRRRPRPVTEAAVLRCMAALQPVTLNGRPVTVPFRFYTSTGSRRTSPVAGLPRGENVLRVGALARPGARPGTQPAPPFVIPFWF